MMSYRKTPTNTQFLYPGKLVDNCTKDCLFTAEYHSGQLALRDRNGQYLSPIGSKAVLKTRSNTVTKDELFSLEDSLPQASFVAALNARFVSVKQGKIFKYDSNRKSLHDKTVCKLSHLSNFCTFVETIFLDFKIALSKIF